MFSLKNLPSASSAFSAYASISAFIMLVRTIVDQLIPHHFQNWIISTIHRYLKLRASSTMTLIIEDHNGMSRNQIFDDSETYLCTQLNPNVDILKITKTPKDKQVTLNFAQTETIPDLFQGIHILWKFVCTEKHSNGGSNGYDFYNNRDVVVPKRTETRHFEMQFDKKHKETVFESYIPFLHKKAKQIRDEKRVVRLHSLAGSYGVGSSWDSINLDHPSTFDKLAMDDSKKRSLIEDLDRFVERKKYYRKVGKAWKRGYLLYGPPGTGKSSLIAAMANYLKFDIYDLQLTNITNDSCWRKLFLSTTNKSILVIEDIDCSVELPDREMAATRRPRDPQFSLSGLLNFIDGLWSSCGDERIIIFTTNNKDKLDPALLRPGRMDMHVHMSYLTADGFRLLASNYLDISDRHWRFVEIEDLIGSMKVTPAEVAEELMKSNDVDISLGGLVDFLKRKKLESSESKETKKQIGMQGK